MSAGRCIGLGRRGGIFRFAHRYGVAVWFRIAGRPGAKLKQLVRTGIVKHLSNEARKPGSYNLHHVPGSPDRRQLLRGGPP
ncbi:hypothetical protein [Streptomyces sp. P9-A2]|uniref:hypothetical protein n=1 Tax=Streptomyces sp. P9-A2 TaxID=3072284 RepID=UPI002FC94317